MHIEPYFQPHRRLPEIKKPEALTKDSYRYRQMPGKKKSKKKSKEET